MTWQQVLDELRLLYSEKRTQIEILDQKGKRSAEEMALKHLRLERLKTIGQMVAELIQKDRKDAA